MPNKDPTKQRAYRKRYYKTAAGKAAIDRANKRYAANNRPKMVEYQKKHRAKFNAHYRDVVRLRLYKPTRKEPLCCEACGVPFASMKKGSQCDHDHNTGLFRGWLCPNCNWALGCAKDSRVILQKLIDYLDRAELLS